MLRLQDLRPPKVVDSASVGVSHCVEEWRKRRENCDGPRAARCVVSGRMSNDVAWRRLKVE